LLPCAAHAQDIVVTGRGLRTAEAERAYDSVTIDRARLNGTASGRLEDALRDVAGLQQFRRSDARSANPTSQGVTLRGLGGNAASRALVLLDGVPQGDPFGGFISWPLYTPARIGSARVTRGGGSGASGPGALAGTIELESIGADTAPDLATTVAVGSAMAIDASALASASVGGGFAMLSGAFARGDGFVPVIAAQRGPADQGTRYRSGSIVARGVAPARFGEMQAALSLFDDRRTRGTAFTNNSTTGADASLRAVGDRFSLTGYVQLRSFASQFASVAAGRATVTQTLDQYETPATGLGARFEWRPALGRTGLRIGGDWRRVRGETRERFSFANGSATRLREAGGSSHTVGGFVEATRSLGALTLTGTARIDRWSIGTGRLNERTLGGATLTDDVFASRQGWEATRRAGAVVAITPRLSARAAAYRGWRLPTLNELYRPFRLGPDATAANAALTPERLDGAEIGGTWRPSANLQINATAYVNTLRGAIANVTLGTGPGIFPGVGFVAAGGAYRQRRNLDAIDVRGAEIDATATHGDWRATLSYAFTDAHIRASGAALALDGLRPAQVAPHALSATVGWRGLSVTTRYTAAQFDDDQNRRALASALTVDAVARVPLTRGLAIELRVENIGDTRIEAAIAGDGTIERATPRTIWLALSWRGPH